MIKNYEIRIKLNLSNRWDKIIFNELLKDAPRRTWPTLIRYAVVEFLKTKKQTQKPEQFISLPLPEDLAEKIDRF